MKHWAIRESCDCGAGGGKQRQGLGSMVGAIHTVD